MANPGRMSLLFSSGSFVVICLVLVAQAVASRRLDVVERDLPLPGLHSLPNQIGSWRAGDERALQPEEAATLKPDEYILRDYVSADGRIPINVFVAYFKSLQNAYGPHSPRICLPGSGWLVSSSKQISLPVGGRPEGIPVNEYVMEKGVDRIFVVYWYQNSRNIWADEYWAKLRLAIAAPHRRSRRCAHGRRGTLTSITICRNFTARTNSVRRPISRDPAPGGISSNASSIFSRRN